MCGTNEPSASHIHKLEIRTEYCDFSISILLDHSVWSTFIVFLPTLIESLLYSRHFSRVWDTAVHAWFKKKKSFLEMTLWY